MAGGMVERELLLPLDLCTVVTATDAADYTTLQLGEAQWEDEAADLGPHLEGVCPLRGATGRTLRAAEQVQGPGAGEGRGAPRNPWEQF